LKTQKLLQEKSEEEVCLIMNLLIFEASTWLWAILNR
jgi:hypothetical protein